MNNPIFDKNFKTVLYEYPRIAGMINISTMRDIIPVESAHPPEINATKLADSNFVALFGLPDADFLLELYKKVQPTTTILIIEKEPGLFYKIINKHDISSIIEGWQVKFIIGADESCFDEEFAQYYFPVDSLYIIKDERSTLLDPQYYSIAEARLRVICERRRNPQPEIRAKKYKFLMMVGTRGTGWPYILQDVVWALHKLGHSVRLLHTSAKGSRYFLSKEISANRPDFIFLLDAIGLKVDDLSKYEIPYISWFFDNPFNWLNESFISDYYHIFVWDKTYVDELKRAGFRHAYYMPLAANPDVFYPRKENEKFICDISFAGSSLIDLPELNFDSESKIRFVNYIADKVCESPWIPLCDIISEINREKGVDFRLDDPAKFRDFELFLQNYSRTVYRMRIIEASLEFEPHLYGDEGWRKITEKKHGVYRGRIDNRIDLPVLYSSSRINLNITVPQLRNSYSHRAFEIPACGGFLLSDYRPEAEQFFEIDRELICFRTMGDLIQKATYFLKNDKERNEISQRARRRVLEEHTYVHRLKKIISMFDAK